MKFYINYKKVTRKEVTELLGKETVAKYVKEAKMEHEIDPMVELTWYIGGNKFLEVRF